MQKCLAIIIVDDCVVEENGEEFYIHLKNTPDLDHRIKLSSEPAVITINDDDSLLVGLEQTSYTAIKMNESVEVCAIVISGCYAAFSFHINFKTLNDSADADRDFTPPQNKTLTFSAKQEKLCVIVEVEDDERVEQQESFWITLERNAGLNGRITITSDIVEIVIPNDDVAMIGFARTLYTVNEGSTVSFYVKVVDGTDEECLVNFPFNISFSIRGGTAGAATDYISYTTTLTFAACDTMEYASLTILNDCVLEEEESFNIILGRTNDLPDKIKIDRGHAIVTIRDDDYIVVGLKETEVSIQEDINRTKVCAVIRSSGVDCYVEFSFTVRLRTYNNNANSPEDYTHVNTNLIFEANEAEVCVDICIENDSVAEQTESFVVSLERTPDLHRRIILHPTEGTIVINDDDEIIIGLYNEPGEVLESVGEVEVCVIVFMPQLPCPIMYPFAINIFTTDDTARSDEHYIEPDAVLMFPVCVTKQCKNITIIDDLTYEKAKSFIVSMEEPTSLTSHTLNPRQLSITINDDDEVTIGFEYTVYNTTETRGEVVVCAAVSSPIVSCPAATAINVRLSYSEGTADDRGDYKKGPSSLMFNSCHRRSCATIMIVDDIQPEMNESFSITLQSFITRVTINPSKFNATIRIINDADGAQVGLPNVPYNVSELETMIMVCASVISPSLTCPIEFSFDVRLYTIDGTAASPVDFIANSATLTFDECETEQCMRVDIVNDNRGEAEIESFTVILQTTPNLDVRINLDPTNVVINIYDDDE
jgi:hypothetical protein